MRWRTPQRLDSRRRRRFLFIPKEIGDEWRWLETAEWDEMYFLATFFRGSWQPTNWVNP